MQVSDDSGVSHDNCLKEDLMPQKNRQGEKKEDESSSTPALAVEEKLDADDGEKQDADEVECIVDKAKESSEFTGDSSIELNIKAIVEDTVKLEAVKQAERTAEEQELKTMKLGKHIHLNGSINEFNNYASGNDHLLNKNENRPEFKTKILWQMNQSLPINKPTASSSNLRIWVLSVLMLVLAVVFFHPHKSVSVVQ